MIAEEKIIIALDTQDEKRFSSLLSALEGKKVWVKIGMECFYSLGPSAVHSAKEKGYKIFLDLKLHDIPNTVGKSLSALSALPFDMINVHAAGGSEMMKKAAEVIHGIPSSPLLIAVTQLTSTSQRMIMMNSGFPEIFWKVSLTLQNLLKTAGFMESSPPLLRPRRLSLSAVLDFSP